MSRGRADAARERGLTTRGRCLLAGGLAAILCAFLLDERDLLRLGVVAAALPVVAMLATVPRRPRLSAVRRARPERLRPGTTGTIELSVTNSGPLRTPPLNVTDPATEDLTAGARCALPPLAPGATATMRYRLRATRRGQFIVAAPRVHSGDPFGLWSASRVLDCTTEVMVVPQVVPLSGTPSASGARSAASGTAAAGTSSGDADVTVRPYHRGDDIRTIHWRASARRDELMVRNREPVSHSGVTVLLDHRAAAHRGLGADASLELAVTAAASISLHLASNDYQLQLLGHHGDVIASGNDVADDVLAGLARLAPDQSRQIRPAAIRVPGMLIAVLGELEEQTAYALAATRPRATTALALLLDVGDWDPSPTVARTAVDAAATLRSSGWRVATMRRGDGLPAVWRLLCAGSRGGDLLASGRTVS